MLIVSPQTCTEYWTMARAHRDDHAQTGESRFSETSEPLEHVRIVGSELLATTVLHTFAKASPTTSASPSAPPDCPSGQAAMPVFSFCWPRVEQAAPLPRQRDAHGRRARLALASGSALFFRAYRCRTLVQSVQLSDVLLQSKSKQLH